MQRSIDSFFKKIPSDKKKEEDVSPAPKKRKARVISSDEEEIPESPQVSKPRDHKKTRKESEKSPKTHSGSRDASKKPTLSKLQTTSKKELQHVDPSALFGGTTLRVAAKKPPKPKEQAVIEMEQDKEIDASLMEIDEELLGSKEINKSNCVESNDHKKEHKIPHKSNSPVRQMHAELSPDKTLPSELAAKAETIKSPTAQKSQHNKDKEEHHHQKSENKEKLSSPSAKKMKLDKNSEETSSADKVDKHKSSFDKKLTPVKEQKISLENERAASSKESTVHKVNENTPKSGKKKEKITPKVKMEHTDLNSSVLSDEERHERKRMTAILYQKYKNRSSCINPGSKDVPKGKPNCLAGLSFLITGILESLERDEAISIIKDYGGKVMTTVGKRLNYLIVGEEAGPKKLAQAEEFNVTVLSEDTFFDLIREKSGDNKKKNGDSFKSENQTTSPKKKTSIEKGEETLKKKEEIKTPSKNKHKQEISMSEAELNNNNKNVEKKSLEVSDQKPLVIKTEVSEYAMAWVDKYKPTSVKEIIGQQGAASNVVKLKNWLTKWYTNHDGKKKLQKPNPWAKNDDGSYYKAALLSGPPGIGKTTTATLICQELGFDAVEFNASDTRSKRLLKEEVSELLSNKSLYGYFHSNAQAVTKKHVLIMDEVDGMAGNEDRGGMQELIGLIKESSVPIICMCNDRNHQKMRSLVNYCYDLRFNRPRLEQIKGRIMSICFKENIKIEPAKIEEIIAATNNDIRQSINHISLLSAGKELSLKSDSAKSGEKTAQKDLKMGPWEVVRKVFSADEHKHMNLNDKCDLFFHDYSLAPLFVQQNYLQVSPAGPKSEVLQKVALTADALSLGDLVDKRIRSNMAWSLLPTQAVFSSVMPGEYMCGHFTGQINFPGWLGKNSRANKRNRLSQEIHDHTRLRTSGSRQSIRLDYAPFLLANIVRPLKQNEMTGVEQSLNVLKEYHLLREDIDSLIELTTWPGKKSIMDTVDGRVKAALTRAYNKEVLAYSYSVAAGVKKKKAEPVDEIELLGVEGEEGEVVVDSDDEKNDDLENDALIKAKKKPAASSTSSKTSTSAKATGKKAATSKAKAKK